MESVHKNYEFFQNFMTRFHALEWGIILQGERDLANRISAMHPNHGLATLQLGKLRNDARVAGWITW